RPPRLRHREPHQDPSRRVRSMARLAVVVIALFSMTARSETIHVPENLRGRVRVAFELELREDFFGAIADYFDHSEVDLRDPAKLSDKSLATIQPPLTLERLAQLPASVVAELTHGLKLEPK